MSFAAKEDQTLPEILAHLRGRVNIITHDYRLGNLCQGSEEQPEQTLVLDYDAKKITTAVDRRRFADAVIDFFAKAGNTLVCENVDGGFITYENVTLDMETEVGIDGLNIFLHDDPIEDGREKAEALAQLKRHPDTKAEAAMTFIPRGDFTDQSIAYTTQLLAKASQQIETSLAVAK